MNIFLYTLPIAILVSVSQLIIKWRSRFITLDDTSFVLKLALYFSDKYIVIAYFMALFGSFIWLLVIPRINLSIGFPIYIGSTFLLVIVGSVVFLNESLSVLRLCAILFIVFGIILGGIAD